MEVIVDYLKTAGGATLTQIVILLGPGLILAILNHLLADQVWKSAIAVMGWRNFAYTFGLIGIPVHEFGHALFNLLFGHTITDVALFDPDNPNSSGHVSYRYKEDSLYQQIGIFFSAIGPIILGSLVLYLAATFLLGEWLFAPTKAVMVNGDTFGSLKGVQQFAEQVYAAAIVMFESFFRASNLTDWKFYLFIYLAFSVGSAITLSAADISNAVTGFITILIVLLMFNLATIWIGNFTANYMGLATQYFGTFYSIMIFTMVLNLFAFALFTGLRVLVFTRRAI